MNASLFIFLGATFASALLLVALYRQDEKLAPPRSDPDAHWLAPRRAIAFGVAKTALLHGVVAAFLAMMSVATWGRIAPQLGLPELPPEAAEFMRLSNARDASELAPLPGVFAQTSLLHHVATAWIGVFFLHTLWRCLGVSIYDIFVSYKSEDVALARRIADAFIAAGWNVWFAEYRILLDRRAQFLPMFGIGAIESRYGLVITNDRWAESKHCSREVRLLLSTKTPEEVLEVRAPGQPLPHQRFPKLAQCPALETTDVNKILNFVAGQTDLPACPDHQLPLTPPASQARFQTYFDGRPCSIEVGHWDLFGDPASLSGVAWRYKHLPTGVLEGKVVISPMDAEQIAIEKRWGLGEAFMFDVMAHHARKTMKRQKGRARGVHLFFYQGRPQMGLTHWGGDFPAWHRNILLDVWNSAANRAANFHFLFRFQGSFRDYCRHSHVMDELALSLQWT